MNREYIQENLKYNKYFWNAICYDLNKYWYKNVYCGWEYSIGGAWLFEMWSSTTW